jgi:hypothetical protein
LLLILKGRGFSRAVKESKAKLALAAGATVVCNFLTSGTSHLSPQVKPAGH